MRGYVTRTLSRTMKKKKLPLRLQLAATTIRHLSKAELLPIMGGSVQTEAASDTRTACTTRLGDWPK